MKSDRKSELDFKKSIQYQKEDEQLAKHFEGSIVESPDVNFLVHEGVLFYQKKTMTDWQIVIPSRLQIICVKTIHTKLGHPRVYKTLENLKTFH